MFSSLYIIALYPIYYHGISTSYSMSPQICSLFSYSLYNLIGKHPYPSIGMTNDGNERNKKEFRYSTAGEFFPA